MLASVVKGKSKVSVKGTAAAEGNKLAVSVSDDEWKKALDSAKQSGSSLVVEASSDTKEAQLTITEEQLAVLKDMPDDSSIVLSWNNASASLPLSALKQVPAGSGLLITIKEAADGKSVFTKQHADAALLGTPYVVTVVTVANGVAKPFALSSDQAVQIAFLLNKGVDANSVGVLYTEGDKAYPVPAIFTATKDGQTVVTVTRSGFGTYVVAQRDIAFSDIGTSWAKTQIQLLANKFILNGTTESTFSPKSNVTRAQFATMLVNALGLSKQTAGAPFGDVGQSEWFAEDVATAYAAGLITGSNGQFRPNDEISRQELAVMLVRALELRKNQGATDNAAGKQYGDAEQFGGFAQASIEAVTEAGLMNGSESNGVFYFRPNDSTTRAEAAKVLLELLASANLINK